MKNAAVYSHRDGRLYSEWIFELMTDVLEVVMSTEREDSRKDNTTAELSSMDVMKIPEKLELPSWNFPAQFHSAGYTFKPELVTDLAVIDAVCERAYKWLNEERSRLIDLHEKNVPSLKNNREIVSGIKTMFQKFGILETYREYKYKTSRSRTKDWVTTSCSWMGEINKFIPTSDGFSEIERTLNSRSNVVEEFRKKHTDRIEKFNWEKQKNEKAAEAIQLLAELKVRYGLPFTADEYTVLSKIVNQDKYLRLAHQLLCNRNDWSDGYEYAELGLEGFKIETEVDQEIYNEIDDIITSRAVDGRNFRDCKWNYDVLFSMAEPSLLEDYYKLTQYFNLQ